MIKKSIGFAVLMFSSIGANAISIDVGLEDVLIGQIEKGAIGAPKNASPNAEMDWASGLLGGVSLDYATEQSNVFYFPSVEDDATYAFMLFGGADYFVIKNSTHWALFENKSSLSWAVFNASSLDEGFNLNGEGTISHVRGFNNVNPVPIPGSAALFSLALAGFAFYRRKFKA